MLIDFENIESKFKKATMTAQYKSLVSKIKESKKIYVIGNGGLHFVASHMATDMTRLIQDKVFYSFDSVGFVTSNSNDHGFGKVFVRWLETFTVTDTPKEALILGLSCSGNSSNIISSLHWAEKAGFNTFMVSGQKSQILKNNVDELVFDCEYFHTVEVMCMMMFYDLIHMIGSHCPSISKEKIRMGNSYLRNLSSEK